MRKILLIIIVFFTFSNLSAQFVRGWGIKAGMTISNQTWDYSQALDLDFESKDRIGLNLGVYLELLDIPFFSIVTEVNYIQKGMKFEVVRTSEVNPHSDDFVDWDTRIDYLNLTALAKLRLNYGILKPYIVVGPKFDYELGKSYGEVDASEIEDKFSEGNLGAKVGIGTEINFLPITLLVEVLYNADFDELYENQNLKVSTNSFDLRIGILF